MNLSWMYWFLLKPVKCSPTKISKSPGLEFRAGCYDGVVDLIDLILDIGLEVLVEHGVTKRIILLLEHLGEDVVEIESEGHAKDASCGIH